jgi:YfiH family protein
MGKATTRVAAGFIWTDGPAGRALVAEPLQLLAPHVFTTRALSFRGAASADDHGRLARALDVRPEHLVGVRQVHGREVHLVHAANQANADGAPQVEADAILCTDPARAVMVRIADCVPILLADRRRRVVAAVHAGWRGTAAGVARATVDAVGRLGIPPSDLVAAIGPSAGPCCYQVDRPVHAAFHAAWPTASAWFRPDGTDRWRLDLWRANVDQLIEGGLAREHIHQSGLCTVHQPDLFHSHRRDGAGAGRLAAAISLRSPMRSTRARRPD